MKNYFGSDKQAISKKKQGKTLLVEWNWKAFKTTEGFPVSEDLLDWVIGQDPALKEAFLCLDEWVHKLEVLNKTNWLDSWKDPTKPKPSTKTIISPGPYLLLLGDPGTGKSLLGRALAEKLTQTYHQRKILLHDVLCWKNPLVPSQPLISIHNAGEGKKLVAAELKKEQKQKRATKSAVKSLQWFLLLTGLALITLGFYLLGQAGVMWGNNPLIGVTPLQDFFSKDFMTYLVAKLGGILPITFIPGGGLLIFGFFVWIFSKMGAGLTPLRGIGGSQQADSPKLLIDNSLNSAPFIDATGHGSAQLFGSVAWDPYQSGNMGTPEHQRVTAGDVHRASFGILYIDEIKNLGVDEAVTLLTVLEEGQLPIALRSRWHGGDTAAMAVSTDPAPTITFLVGAGNFDSIGLIHPALMDRIYGYGKVVRMNNDMPNTVENRRKYVQFIAQEVKRFNLIPFSREACIEVTEEGRRRSDKRDALSTRFRPLISIIKTASTLAMNENCEVVEARHVKEAIESHCKTIQRQILEHTMIERGRFLEIIPKGISFGKIHGLAVVKDSFSGEMMGAVLCVKAQMTTRSEISRNYPLKGYYKVTGVAKGQSFISDSISKVRSVILQKYGVDIAQDYFTHIDFAQSFGVDGSSAGVTMAILICALMEKKGIKQGVAVTGEINLEEKGQVMITAVGGVHEKIKAAEAWGFKKVVIPKKNYEHSIDPKDYKIKIVSAATLEEYLKECLFSTDDDKKQQS